MSDRSQVRVTALRARGGAIWFRWDTRLPITTGEEQRVLPLEDGPLTLQGPVDLTGPVFRWDICVSLRATGSAGAPSGYMAVVTTRACGAGDPAAEPLTLETPWDNVVVTRTTSVVPHGRKELEEVGAGFVIVPAAMLSSGADLSGGGLPLLVVMGGSLATGGLLLAASRIAPGPHTRTVVLHPRHQRVDTRATRRSHRS